MCNSARDTGKKVRCICRGFVGMLQSQGVTEMMVDVISGNVLCMENSIFKLWADWNS